MAKIGKLLKKLAAGEFTELSYRAHEEWIRKQERQHHRRGDSLFAEDAYDKIFSEQFLGAYRKDDGAHLADALRDKQYPFFPGFGDAEKFAAWVDASGKVSREEILSRADKICADRFPVFSLGCLEYGSPPRWNYDPVNGKEGPKQFYGDIPYLDASIVGDSKVIWEISRWQFVYDLGQAYLLTHDEKYPHKFFDLIVNWSDSHCDYEGIAFCSALEFAFRIHSLIWALDFFHASPAITESAACAVYRLLCISGRFLEDHLSRYFSPNTHLLGEAWGLCLLGMLFPEFQEAERWHKLGLEIMVAEMSNQFTADGFHAELSTAYHAYCVEFLAVLIVLMQQRGREVPAEIGNRFRQAVEQLEQLQLPDGSWPHIGDEDGGRALFLSRAKSHDFRPILEAGKALLAKQAGDGYNATYPETFFLAGESSTAISEKAGRRSSVVLPDTGYCVLRAEHDQYLLFQAGPFGYHDCPHSHADMLHFDFSAGDDNFIVDPGTFIYTGNLERRNSYRSSEMHNGPHLDELYSPNDPFAWLEKPDCKIIEQQLSKSKQVVSAAYGLKLKDGAEVEVGRRVEYIGRCIWIITDEIAGGGRIRASWNFISPFSIDAQRACFSISGKNSSIRLLPLAIVGELKTSVVESTYSTDYLCEEPALSLRADVAADDRILIVWVMQLETPEIPLILSLKAEDEGNITVATDNETLIFEIKPILGDH